MKKLVAAFVGLNTLDIMLTLIFVVNGASAEGNPIMAKVLAMPLHGILLFKVGLPVILGLALIAVDKTPAARQVQPKGALICCVVGLTVVCLWNMLGVFI